MYSKEIRNYDDCSGNFKLLERSTTNYHLCRTSIRQAVNAMSVKNYVSYNLTKFHAFPRAVHHMRPVATTG